MKKSTQTLGQVLLCVLGLWVSSPILSSTLTTGQYDAEFSRHWGRYLPAYDYAWGIAQCYQESLLNPRARSPVGAMGLCQFMPQTFEECRKALRLPANYSPWDPKVSIRCNAWYMSQQLKIWSSPRPPLEHLYLGFASYNAGAGNILKAQKICLNALLWKDIQLCLVQVTGHYHKETLTYVDKIVRWYKELKNELHEIFRRVASIRTYWNSNSSGQFLRGSEMGEGSTNCFP